MSGRCWTMHAKIRAEERYGLDLSHEDFEAILAEIQSGRSPCMRMVEKVGRVHIVRFHGDILIVALALDKDVITTMLPPDYFCKGSTLKRAQGANIAKQKHKKTASALNPEYRRARWKNDIAYDEEEG